MPKIAQDKLVCPHCGAEESSAHEPFSPWGLKVHIARMHGPNRTPKKRRKEIGLKGGAASAARSNRLPVVVIEPSTNGRSEPQFTLDMLMNMAAREVQNNRRVKCCPKCGHSISMSELGEAIAEKIMEKLKHEAQTS